MDQFLSRYPYRNKPYQHQEAFLSRFWSRQEVGLFADMGTGKSFMMINNFSMLYDNGKINAVLIIAPKGVYRNWCNVEIPKHMPAHIVFRIAAWNPSPRKAEAQALDALFDVTEDLKILVMNIEALSTEKGFKYAQRFAMFHRTFAAVDESTTIKTPSAKRAKNVVKVGKHCKYRRIMTGSPVTKDPMDLYQQCLFLSEDCLGHSSFYTFQARYAILVERRMPSHTFKQVVGYRHLDELKEKLDKFSFRVTKEQCLDLPEKVYVRREVELTEEQGKAYMDMKQMALSMFDEGMMTTTNALTQLMRMHQIVCGHVKLDDGTLMTLPSNRLNELLSTIEEVDGKVIIWATYRADIESIRLALQKAYGMDSVAAYYGDTKDEERSQIVSDFQDMEKPLRFFVGNPSTGGYGLTLTAAHVVIYYSNSFDLEKRLQSEDRAHRIGQTKNVTYVDLIAVNTVDEKIVKALRDKINIATQVLGEEVKQWLI